ncbi:hypothetical protein TVAG_093570 [Trichomonas vaginalis G3]|uniref:DUF3447 domain-containing protein n=1 Tax=Trichomonas vaginalis (strain ATCC PRA-98 / G3) TaxID=412133 RepID=A2DBI0_TRIV3|nr:protein of unknown function (DUF3447) [Trichomonas vaginalis G3]EAY22183.1 hypothetical protein TVAG_093570 [Trichomonas vaginalis G3]KAI5533359.1 protein of unknown function (DUF3447) [Trichomonas vaginalis G3]|eukprot:XP_001583169.1 hypothetical protein [Trichomonas vaginalis G3]
MDQKAHTEELISKYKDYIATIDALYKLKTRNEDEIDQLFKMIKTNLFDTNLSTPKMIIQQIAGITSCCCHYFKSYWTLFKKIYEEYHPTPSITLSPVFDYFVYKEYGIVFDERSKMMFEEFESNKYSLDVHEENTIYWAIMNDDVKSLTAFTDAKSFDKNQKFYSYMYPDPINGLSLLEVCCIHSSIECFKFLTTKFEAQVTSKCLQYAFISGSQEILNECLKSQKPNAECMLFAIYSHNMDFVNLLIKEYGIQIDLESCGTMLNLQALLAYYEQTNDIFKCFVYSAYFNIPSLCEYFLSLGAKIDSKNNDHTALHAATSNNLKEIVEFLISKGANINEEDGTCLHTAAWFNSNDVAEVLISHGVDV